MGDKIFWVALTIALSAGEAATAGLTVIWFAIGALAGLAAAVVIIQLLITYLIIRVFRRQSMIERIRFSE